MKWAPKKTWQLHLPWYDLIVAASSGVPSGNFNFEPWFKIFDSSSLIESTATSNSSTLLNGFWIKLLLFRLRPLNTDSISHCIYLSNRCERSMVRFKGYVICFDVSQYGDGSPNSQIAKQQSASWRTLLQIYSGKRWVPISRNCFTTRHCRKLCPLVAIIYLPATISVKFSCFGKYSTSKHFSPNFFANQWRVHWKK